MRDTQVHKAVAPTVGRSITIHIGDRVYQGLGREAPKRGLTTGGLAQRLFEAGYAALFGGTGDALLEARVAQIAADASSLNSVPAAPNSEPAAAPPPATTPASAAPARPKQPAPPSPGGLTDAQLRTVRALKAMGKGSPAIARATGIDVVAVKAALKR